MLCQVLWGYLLSDVVPIYKELKLTKEMNMNTVRMNAEQYEISAITEKETKCCGPRGKRDWSIRSGFLLRNVW